MENKYYTPTIEEFHVGFEYEEETIIYTDKGWFTHKDLGWEKKIFDSTSYMENYYLSERVKRGLVGKCDPTIRVKYLDREDVESLGFAQTVEDQYTLDDIEFLIDDDLFVQIIKDDGFLFQGTIKNKSELKRVLKMIGYEN